MTTLSATGTINVKYESNILLYSTNAGISWTPITSFPITLNNTNPTESSLNVIFDTDIYISNPDEYFLFATNNITIDGNNNYFHITATDFTGLFGPTDYGINNYKQINIQNVYITNDNTGTLHDWSGWLVQQSLHGNYSENDTEYLVISNCHSDGPISSGSGGLIGYDASFLSIINCSSSGEIDSLGGGILAAMCNTCQINGCHSSGNIGTDAGGIVGIECYNMYITFCYSTGSIGSYGGGIVGSYRTGTGPSNTIVQQCWSMGNIGMGAGGIVGASMGAGSIGFCYSIGNISGVNAGGIVGYGAFQFNNIENQCVFCCYSTGVIGDLAGGIYGGNAEDCLAIVCYSIGNDATGMGGGSGGIFASSPFNFDTLVAQYCYVCGVDVKIHYDYVNSNAATGDANNWSEYIDSESSGWNDVNSYILNTYGHYISIATNTPYLITEFDTYFYTWPEGELPPGQTYTLNSNLDTNEGLLYLIVNTIANEEPTDALTIDEFNGQLILTNPAPTTIYTAAAIAYYTYDSIPYNYLINGVGFVTSDAPISGICYRGDSLIKTRGMGWQQIDKLIPGTVLNNGSRIKNIIQSYTSYNYLISLCNDTLIITPNHRIRTLEGIVMYANEHPHGKHIPHNNRTPLYNIILDKEQYGFIETGDGSLFAETLFPKHSDSNNYRKNCTKIIPITM